MVLLIVASVVTIPAAVHAGVDGARMYVVEGNMTTPNSGNGTMSQIIMMENPMPISSSLPKSDLTMSVDEYFSKISPFVMGTGVLPAMTTGPGVNVLTVSGPSHSNASIHNNIFWVYALQQGQFPYGYPNCAGCAPTVGLSRPVPLAMASEMTIKIGMSSVPVKLNKKSFCHCMGGWPKLAVFEGPCTPLDVKTPYSTRYTPCLNKSGCPPYPQSEHMEKSALAPALGPHGFHCAPMDEVEF